VPSEAELARLVGTFYGRIRRDEVLGPIFERAIDDWPEHLEKLTDFWSSVMLTTGRYKGNPVAAHAKHLASIEPEMFDRWLRIWGETASEILAPEAAVAIKAKADRIAESLKLAMFFRLGRAAAAVL
jgi:hemoglobin